jgi:hypothetical protein
MTESLPLEAGHIYEVTAASNWGIHGDAADRVRLVFDPGRKSDCGIAPGQHRISLPGHALAKMDLAGLPDSEPGKISSPVMTAQRETVPVPVIAVSI